jgi:hypothetical protein
MKPRSLDAIADDINKLSRASIFDIGGLLLEAKTQCEHGQWLKWIWRNFEYAEGTAQRYMTAATLAGKYRTVRDLKISARTVYRLAGEDEADLPAIIKELAKHATKTRLGVLDAERVIKIGIGRGRYGDDDLPDATLVLLGGLLNGSCLWHKKAIAALRKQRPDDDDAAREIVDEVMDQYFKAKEAKDAAEWQAFLRKRGPEIVPPDPILDGDPPVLPPPITPPEPQKLGGGEQEIFKIAVKQLRGLQTKPLATFAELCSPTELREVIDFLTDVAAKLKAEVS